jgi:hypothetical protein
MAKSAKTESSPREAESKAGGGKTPIADRLVKYSRARANLFHTPGQEAYATIRHEGHRETWAIRSPEFARWVEQVFYTVEQKVPYTQAVSSAISTLDGLARFGGRTREVHVRCAWDQGRIYLDLANEDWTAVRIDTEGWRIVRNPPVRFVRTPGMRPLPAPVRGGSIDRLRPFLNLRNDRDWHLFIACLLAAMRPSGPYPIPFICGEYGSGKSTLIRVLRRMIDPAEPADRAPPKSEQDLMVSAFNNWVLAFDNLSTVPPWLSDALCRLATGAGFAARQLYTDRKEACISVMRPVVINSIGSIITRPDLLSRAVILTVPSIGPKARRDEQTFWREFDRAQPRILGALLDAVSHGLRHFGRTHLKEMPRMADFARWVTACEGALGWQSGTFLTAYRDHEAEKVELALAESSLAQPIRKLAAKGWEGTAKALAVKLASMAPGGPPPQDERTVSNQLKELEPVLRDVGVVVTRRRTHGGKRMIRLSGDVGDAEIPAESETDGDDGDDGDDGGGNFSVVNKKKERKKRVRKKVARPPSPASPPSPAALGAVQAGQHGQTNTKEDSP